MFELAGDISVPYSLLDRKGDSTFGCSMIQPKTSPVCNASMRDGRTIEQYVPKSLDDVVLPKEEIQEKEVDENCTTIWPYTRKVMVLSDPHLYPHPYIVQNNGIGTTLKSFSRL